MSAYGLNDSNLYQGGKMTKEIRILTSRILTETDKAKIEFDLEVEEKKGTLWFETSLQWKDSICDNIADGVVVTLLLYAIRGGYDIKSNLPVSKSLLNKLNNHVIPQLVLCTKDAYRTNIICPMGTEEYHPDRVATAMSMGVDAFTTFFEYTKDCPQESDRINLLTFMQSGQTSFSGNEDEVFAGQLEDAKRFAAEYGYDLVDVSSNIYSLYIELFWEEPMIHVSTYRNCGMMLLFQKLIKIYYYSSSYNLDEFHCSLNEDVTHYEKWLLPHISTDAITFYNSNKGMTRLEKTQYLCQYPETYNYLQVCCFARHSCGTCNKCIRTMFTLEHFGVLENYKNVFDLDAFRAHREKNLRILLANGGNSIDAEVLEFYKNEIPLSTKAIVGIFPYLLSDNYLHKLIKMFFKRHPKARELAISIKEKIC